MPRPLLYPFIIPRIRVTADDDPEPGQPSDPAAITTPRPPKSRRPHTDAKVARVRRMIEETVHTYGEIEKRTGVGRATICRWKRDHNWTRPPFAPRATDTIPRPRASQKLKLRLLAERLRLIAERMVRELEETPGADLDKLMAALQVLKMARLEAMGRRRRRRHREEPRTGLWASEREEAIRTALKELRRGGVDIERAPKEALDLVREARLPAEDHPELRARGRRRGR